MKNYERFISVFGQKKYEEFLDMAQDNAPMLRWLLEDEEAKEQVTVKPAVVTEEVIETVEKPRIKRKYRSGNTKVNYDWYVSMVEDFYLSGERSKDIKLRDDGSIRGANTLATLRDRFVAAVGMAGLQESITVHQYNRLTVNECVTLINREVSKNPVVTYKLG